MAIGKYPGKLTVGASAKNIAGVSYPSSDLNQNPNGAIECLNWDLTTIGSIKTRGGWLPRYEFTLLGGASLNGVFAFVNDAGAINWFAVANGKVYHLVGDTPVELVSTGCTFTNGYRWRGDQWHGKLWLGNGHDAPVVILPSGDTFIVKTQVQQSKDDHSGTDKTPSEWGAAPPHGFTLVNRGQAERMYAWNLEKVYFTKLSEPTNWVDADGAAGSGAFVVQANDGDVIQRVIGKFGYMVVFTTTLTLIYSGDGPGDDTTPGIGLDHVVNIGCPGGPDSVFNVGSDTWFFSERGPDNLMRVLNSTELTNGMTGVPVQPHIQSKTNHSLWSGIMGYHDVARRRVIWFAPLSGSTTFNTAYVYQYDVRSWYRYEGWEILCTGTAPDGTVMAGIKQGSHYYIGELHVGNSDNGVDIDALYVTVPYTWTSPDMTKTVPFVDVYSKNEGNAVKMDYSWDFDLETGSESLQSQEFPGVWGVYATNVLRWGPMDQPNLVGVWRKESEIVLNRLDVYGSGKFLTLKFQSEGKGSAEILGWMASPRVKGLR